MRYSWLIWAVLTMFGMLAAGCSQQPATTASIAPQPIANTSKSRIEHLGWNSAWAQTCGFYFDNARLKSSYLAFESQTGTPPDEVAKLGVAYDKVQASIRLVSATKADQCTDARLERIRAAMARYLGGDFSPGEAV